LKEQRNISPLATVSFIQIRPIYASDELFEITLHYKNRTTYWRKYTVQSAETGSSVGNIVSGYGHEVEQWVISIRTFKSVFRTSGGVGGGGMEVEGTTCRPGNELALFPPM